MKEKKIFIVIIAILLVTAAILGGLIYYGKNVKGLSAGGKTDSIDAYQTMDMGDLYGKGTYLTSKDELKLSSNKHLSAKANEEGYTLNLGFVSFGDKYADKLIIDAAAAKGTRAVIKFFDGRSKKPFLETALAETDRYLPGFVDERIYDISEAELTGNKKIRIVIEFGEGAKGEFELRSLCFKDSSIPTMYFNIDEEQGSIAAMNEDKDNSCTGTVAISMPKNYVLQYTEEEIAEGEYVVEDIHGRGNSTWDCDKKPYVMKLGEKADLFGMGEAKKWVLLANYYDKSLMRDKLAYDLAGYMGMDFAVQSVFVDVVMNDRYVGSYLLCEKIEVKENRVDINRLEKTPDAVSEEEINGGYLLQLKPTDRIFKYNLDDVWFGAGFIDKAVVIEYPDLRENDNMEQYNYIMNYYYKFENAVCLGSFTSGNVRYTDVVDLDSFVDFYVIHELFKNNDALYASTYFYKDLDEKMKIGPIWDLDLSAGTYACNHTEKPQGFFLNGQYIFGDLVKDPEFGRRVIERYNEIHDYVVKWYEPDEDGVSLIREYAEMLDTSQEMNFDKWGMGNRGWNAVLCQGSYEDEVSYLEDWLRDRVDWMDGNIDRLMTDHYTVSFVADGENYMDIYAAPGKNAAIPESVPEKEGAEFKGWYFDDNGTKKQFTSIINVNSDITVYAEWKQ